MKKQLTVSYEFFSSREELSQEDQNLINKAYEIAADAYAPYSNFKVGAIAELEDGTTVSGSNQENIAYPSGLCAERVALFYAGANFPDKAVKKLVVVARGNLIEPDMCVSPCGSCRQVIAESEKRQSEEIELLLVSQNGAVWRFERASDLLVFPFGMKES